MRVTAWIWMAVVLGLWLMQFRPLLEKVLP